MTFAGGASFNANDSIRQLMVTLEKVSPMMKDREEDLSFVKTVVQSNDFQSLMHIHNVIKHGSVHTEDPVTKNSVAMSHIVCYHCDNAASREASELFDLLSSPHIHALLVAHDKVANKEFPAAMVDMEQENMKDRRQFRRIRIEKITSEPLGATIKINKDGFVEVSRILHRSLADRSGTLHTGDIIHTINGWKARGSDIDTVANHMRELTGMIEILVGTAHPEKAPARRPAATVRFKAHFDYDPSKDQYLPCRQAGLAFNKGMILHVLNQDDPNWWQAVDDNYSNAKDLRAGLIPSASFRKKLEYEKLRKGLLFNKQRKPFTLRRQRVGAHKQLKYNPHVNEEYSCGEFLMYEEVTKIAPQKNRPRPIVLVGPQGKAMNLDELIEQLVNEGHQKFLRPSKYCTSQSPKIPASEHLIISQQEMEQHIKENKLVEYDKTGNHYSGTSIRQIKNVMEAGKTCLLHIQPQFLKVIRSNGELKPFIIYFRTPEIEHMRNVWKPQSHITEQEMRTLVQQGIDIENKYSHLFDELIIFTDHNTAHQNLLTTSRRLREEFQWVPSSWVRR